MALSWQDVFYVDVENFNEQHEELFGAIDIAYEAVEANRSNDVLEPLFREIISRMVLHFHSEEAFFERILYKEKDEHVRAHIDMRIHAAEFYDSYINGQVKVSTEAMDELVSMFKRHINEHDRKYALFMKKNRLPF